MNGVNFGVKCTTNMADSLAVNNWIDKAVSKQVPDLKVSIFDKK